MMSESSKNKWGQETDKSCLYYMCASAARGLFNEIWNTLYDLSLYIYRLHMIKPDIFVVNAEKVVTETTDISIILLFTDN